MDIFFNKNIYTIFACSIIVDNECIFTWQANAVICDGVSGEKAGRRAAPTYKQRLILFNLSSGRYIIEIKIFLCDIPYFREVLDIIKNHTSKSRYHAKIQDTFSVQFQQPTRSQKKKPSNKKHFTSQNKIYELIIIN